jgi:predicted PurR-regulated permease PerM
MKLTLKNDSLILIPLILIALVVTGIVFKEFRELLLPFAMAVLFSILFYPIVAGLNRKKIPVIFSLVAV